MSTQVDLKRQQGGSVRPGVNLQEVEGIGHVGHPGSGHWEARLTEETRDGSSSAWGKCIWAHLMKPRSLWCLRHKPQLSLSHSWDVCSTSPPCVPEIQVSL